MRLNYQLYLSLDLYNLFLISLQSTHCIFFPNQNYLSNLSTDKKPTGRTDIAHSCKQGVQCYETGELRKGFLLDLKKAHSFTLSCLLCNPMGCHGDHMLLQVTWLRAKRPGSSPGNGKNRELGHARVCVCACVSIHT